MIPGRCLLCLVIGVALQTMPRSGASAQAPAPVESPAPRGLGSWNADSLGNQRVVVRVSAAAPAVRVHIPWRRRDRHPELKRVLVRTGAGTRVANAVTLQITR